MEREKEGGTGDDSVKKIGLRDVSRERGIQDRRRGRGHRNKTGDPKMMLESRKK